MVNKLVISLLILVLILPAMAPEPPPGDWVPPEYHWIIFDGEYDQHPGKGGENGEHKGWDVVVEKVIGWAK